MIKRGTKKLNDYKKNSRLAYSTLINKGKTIINKVNSKTKDRNFKYARLRDQYMKDHPLCEFPFCGKPSVECHHKAGYRDWETDRKSTRLNSSHSAKSRMPSSA